jgi:hypothetical protein
LRVRGFKEKVLGNWRDQIDDFKMLKEDDSHLIQQKLNGNNKLTVEQLNNFTNIDNSIDKISEGKLDN